MRVLITTDTLGGVWDYSMALVEGLLARGCDLALVSMGQIPSADQSSLVRDLATKFNHELRFFPNDYPLEWMQGDLRMERSRELLLHLIATFQPDIFHSNQMCYGNLPCDIPRVVVTHSDVTTWSQECRQSDAIHGGWYQRYHELVSAGLFGADCVVAPSRFQLDQVARHYGSVGHRGVVIYNGSAQREVEETKHMQAATAGRFWDIAKNLRVLRQSEWQFPLYVAGRVEPLGEASSNPAGSQNLHLVGQLSKRSFQELLDKSLIYIGPSLYEPFGLAPLEAAHSGCALVLSDIPSFREIWQDAATYFYPHDPDHLQKTLCDLVANPDECHSMALRALRRARSRYGQDRCVDRYFGLYQNLLAGRMVNDAA